MKILGINHIGIAAKDPRKADWFFREVLGLPFAGEELVKEQKTNTIMFNSSHSQDSTMSRLEILENQDGEEGPIKKYLEKKGGGIHHIALHVDAIEEAIDHLQSFDIEMIDQSPRTGAHKTKVAFVHPRSTGGILVELVQETQHA